MLAFCTCLRMYILAQASTRLHVIDLDPPNCPSYTSEEGSSYGTLITFMAASRRSCRTVWLLDAVLFCDVSGT